MFKIRWPSSRVNRHNLRYFDSLGQGWFGWIVRGRYRKHGEDTASFDATKDQSVIVCMLKEEANLREKQKFLEETQSKAQFSFLTEGDSSKANEGALNVVQLIGICVEKPPFLAIYEECKLGDLKTFLLNSKGN